MVKSAVIVLCALLCTSLAVAQKSKLVAVEAGKSLNEIGELVKGANPLRICPAKYPNGFSIRCEGRNVLPPVIMSITRGRVQTEGRAPYHIGGDIDGNGLTEIFPWNDYLSKRKLPDGTRKIRVRCRHRTKQGQPRKFGRNLIIEADGCENTSPVPAKNEFRSCSVDDAAQKRLYLFTDSQGNAYSFFETEVNDPNGSIQQCILATATQSVIDSAIVLAGGGTCDSVGATCTFEADTCSCRSSTSPCKALSAIEIIGVFVGVVSRCGG
eukprot:IDg1779t1